MFIAYNNSEKYAHMRRNSDLHGLLLTEKYEIKDTKLIDSNQRPSNMVEQFLLRSTKPSSEPRF